MRSVTGLIVSRKMFYKRNYNVHLFEKLSIFCILLKYAQKLVSLQQSLMHRQLIKQQQINGILMEGFKNIMHSGSYRILVKVWYAFLSWKCYMALIFLLWETLIWVSRYIDKRTYHHILKNRQVGQADLQRMFT